jgi:hypothetical protein
VSFIENHFSWFHLPEPNPANRTNPANLANCPTMTRGQQRVNQCPGLLPGKDKDKATYIRCKETMVPLDKGGNGACAKCKLQVHAHAPAAGLAFLQLVNKFEKTCSPFVKEQALLMGRKCHIKLRNAEDALKLELLATPYMRDAETELLGVIVSEADLEGKNDDPTDRAEGTSSEMEVDKVPPFDLALHCERNPSVL